MRDHNLPFGIGFQYMLRNRGAPFCNRIFPYNESLRLLSFYNLLNDIGDFFIDSSNLVHNVDLIPLFTLAQSTAPVFGAFLQRFVHDESSFSLLR